MTLGYLLTAAGLGHMCLGALLFFNASMMQTVRLRFVSWLGFFFFFCGEAPLPIASLPRPRRNVLTRASTQGNLLFVPGESRPRAGRTPCSVILPPTHKEKQFLIDTHYLLFNLSHTTRINNHHNNNNDTQPTRLMKASCSPSGSAGRWRCAPRRATGGAPPLTLPGSC